MSVHPTSPSQLERLADQPRTVGVWLCVWHDTDHGASPDRVAVFASVAHATLTAVRE